MTTKTTGAAELPESRKGKYLTVVYRDIQPGDEARELIIHPKMAASSWSHALHDRDRFHAQVEALSAAQAAVAEEALEGCRA